jgi:hypothetical protein
VPTNVLGESKDQHTRRKETIEQGRGPTPSTNPASGMATPKRVELLKHGMPVIVKVGSRILLRCHSDGAGGIAGTGLQKAGQFFDIWQKAFPDCKARSEQSPASGGGSHDRKVSRIKRSRSVTQCPVGSGAPGVGPYRERRRQSHARSNRSPTNIAGRACRWDRQANRARCQ